jgi:hypothetical protein
MAYTTIDDPTIYFNTVLYTGDDSTSNAISGVGFQPDWVWLKNRSAEAGHQLADVVRGKSGTNFLSLSSDTNAAEAAQGDNDGLNTLGSDGFTVGFTNSTGWNKSGNNYASWNWKAGGSASSNTDGSLTSSVSANQTAGFSIVKWSPSGSGSAKTIGHGLGEVPKMIIMKRYSGTVNWFVYHVGTGNGNATFLDTTDASTSVNYWNSTTPTSSVFTVNGAAEASGDFIGYCFAEKQGFSKIGQYTGNGNVDGAFVYTGFKPAWLLTKRLDSATSGNWNISDNKRDPSNVVTQIFFADDAQSELTASNVYDYYSNGFKVRESGAGTNASGSTYIYMAFAESPFVNSKKVPNNAR